MKKTDKKTANKAGQPEKRKAKTMTKWKPSRYRRRRGTNENYKGEKNEEQKRPRIGRPLQHEWKARSPGILFRGGDAIPRSGDTHRLRYVQFHSHVRPFVFFMHPSIPPSCIGNRNDGLSRERFVVNGQMTQQRMRTHRRSPLSCDSPNARRRFALGD